MSATTPPCDETDIDSALQQAVELLRSAGGAQSEDIRSVVAALDRLRDERSDEGRGLPGRDAVSLVFDVSDLLGYFPDNRAPTGIQRVQMEVLGSFLARRVPIRLCRFVPKKGHWVEAPKDLFTAVCAASRQGGDISAPDWRATYQRLDAATTAAKPLMFPGGSVLINLGSSWWLPDYFLQVRALKSQFGVKYVPFVHDVIPAATPQYCAPELVAQFVPWISQVIDNADHFLANSDATKRDLISLASQLGRSVRDEDVDVVRLDADYRTSDATMPARASFPPITRPYVLLVSTFEIRKNQLGALDAWRQLINERGIDDVPQLVLVGKNGFRGNEVHERVSGDVTLASRVTLLENLDDGELAALYRGALFTLYPSLYEGWGLPVTEALCYGKVPLAADNSSLPEAGGPYAVYFSSGSPSDLLAEIKRLVWDGAARRTLEDRIRREFRPRSWAAIADQVRDMVDRWHAGGAVRSAVVTPHAEAGRYYPMALRKSAAIWPGMGSAEGFRSGLGWWEQEDWGCWSSASGGKLSMTLDPAIPVEIAIDVRSANPDGGHCIVIDDKGVTLAEGNTTHEGSRWIYVPVPAGSAEIRLTLAADRVSHVSGEWRTLGVGLRGFFVLPAGDPAARRDFVEAVALGALGDFSAYRKPAG